MAYTDADFLLAVVRYILLSALMVFNLVTLILSSALFNIESDNGVYVPIVVYFIVLSSFSLAFLLPIIVIDVSRRNAFVSRVIFEMIWLTLLWILNLVGASKLTASNGCDISGACHSIQNALEVFTWLSVSILIIHLALLFLFSIAHRNGVTNVWTRTFHDVSWFTSSKEQEQETKETRSRGATSAPPPGRTTRERTSRAPRVSAPQETTRRSVPAERDHRRSRRSHRAARESRPQLPPPESLESRTRQPFVQEPLPFVSNEGIISAQGSFEPARFSRQLEQLARRQGDDDGVAAPDHPPQPPPVAFRFERHRSSRERGEKQVANPNTETETSSTTRPRQSSDPDPFAEQVAGPSRIADPGPSRQPPRIVPANLAMPSSDEQHFEPWQRTTSPTSPFTPVQRGGVRPLPNVQDFYGQHVQSAMKKRPPGAGNVLGLSTNFAPGAQAPSPETTSPAQHYPMSPRRRDRDPGYS